MLRETNGLKNSFCNLYLIEKKPAGTVYICSYWNQTLLTIHLIIYLFNTYLPSASQ